MDGFSSTFRIGPKQPVQVRKSQLRMVLGKLKKLETQLMKLPIPEH